MISFRSVFSAPFTRTRQAQKVQRTLHEDKTSTKGWDVSSCPTTTGGGVALPVTMEAQVCTLAPPGQRATAPCALRVECAAPVHRTSKRMLAVSESSRRASTLFMEAKACESSFWGGFQPPFLLPYPTSCT